MSSLVNLSQHQWLYEFHTQSGVQPDVWRGSVPSAVGQWSRPTAAVPVQWRHRETRHKLISWSTLATDQPDPAWFSSSAPRAEKLISLGLITGDTLELTEPYSACFPLLCYEESRLGNNFQNEAAEAVVNPCSLHDATHERAWRDEVIGFGAVTVSPNDQRGQQLRKEN